jgi:hypothetical protein
MPNPPFDRLMEASDSVGRYAVKLLSYKETDAGYSVAAAHIAALREAGIPYSFRPRRDVAYPYGIFVPKKQLRLARETVERLGLGADVA